VCSSDLCHKPLPSSQDFVFSYGKMAAFPR